MMREEMLEIAAAAADLEEKRAILRECVQAAALRSLHEAEAFLSVALTGEAARRFALGSPGYAADLEFVLMDKKEYKPERWLFAIKRRLYFMGLDPRIAFARKLSVHAGWIKVPGLLAEAGFEESSAETLGVKLIIDIEASKESANAIKLVEARGEHFSLRYLA